MFNRFIIAASVILFTGIAQAQEVNLPAGMVCKVTETKITVDAKGRTIITVKKVCSK